jgi:hypothetical protein
MCPADVSNGRYTCNWISGAKRRAGQDDRISSKLANLWAAAASMV